MLQHLHWFPLALLLVAAKAETLERCLDVAPHGQCLLVGAGHEEVVVERGKEPYALPLMCAETLLAGDRRKSSCQKRGPQVSYQRLHEHTKHVRRRVPAH
eukprot:1179842-Prorocentrum_minimum.AAC.2